MPGLGPLGPDASPGRWGDRSGPVPTAEGHPRRLPRPGPVNRRVAVGEYSVYGLCHAWNTGYVARIHRTARRGREGDPMSVKQGLLALLAESPKYGAQLRSEFEERTGGTWPLNVGQVYTTLARLSATVSSSRSEPRTRRAASRTGSPSGGWPSRGAGGRRRSTGTRPHATSWPSSSPWRSPCPASTSRPWPRPSARRPFSTCTTSPASSSAPSTPRSGTMRPTRPVGRATSPGSSSSRTSCSPRRPRCVARPRGGPARPRGDPPPANRDHPRHRARRSHGGGRHTGRGRDGGGDPMSLLVLRDVTRIHGSGPTTSPPSTP